MKALANNDIQLFKFYFIIDEDNFEDEDFHNKEKEEEEEVEDNRNDNRSHGMGSYVGSQQGAEEAGDKSTTPSNENSVGGGGSVEETSFMMNRDIDSSKKHDLPQVSDLQRLPKIPSLQSYQAAASFQQQPDDTSLVEQVLRKDASAVNNHGLTSDPFGNSGGIKDSMSLATVDSGASIKSLETSMVDPGSIINNKYGKTVGEWP